ncbi:MAG: DUF1203 domain-containing protein [Ilumatobacteraceae bacterium]
MPFRIAPLPPSTAARLREAATVVRVADASPGYPCRACLRDAALGDELVLVSHDPFAGWDAAASSPYRSASPIYLHRRDCAADVDPDPVPDQLVRRRLSVRAFDERAMMLDGRVVDGVDLRATLDELAAVPGVAKVFVHNAGPGCFAAAVEVVDGRSNPAQRRR